MINTGEEGRAARLIYLIAGEVIVNEGKMKNNSQGEIR